MAFLQRTEIFINHHRNKRIFFFFCRMKNLPFKLTYLVQHELARVTFNLKCSAFKFLSTSCCFTHKIVDLQNIYQVFFPSPFFNDCYCSLVKRKWMLLAARKRLREELIKMLKLLCSIAFQVTSRLWIVTDIIGSHFFPVFYFRTFPLSTDSKIKCLNMVAF